ncbi:MAG: tyrosine-type recombinase/integrase [Deferribacteraceae bacterium]|jgi:integrase/recombinase XerD|nr:tyrosine-type recombinase/integrase [Deferribacteraceae bacterium]
MIDIRQEVEAYLYYCEYQKKLSIKSIQAYSIDLKQFLSHNNNQNLSKSTISNYITYLHKTYMPQAAKRKLASVRAFLNYLEFEEIIDANPIRKIKTKFKEPKILPKIIPLRVIEQLLAAVHQEWANAKTAHANCAALRNVAIMEILFATGMRVSELCSLKADDVHLEEGNIYIMGKGSKERIIQIGNDEVLSILRQYQEAFSPSAFFFINRFSSRISEQSVRFMLRKFRIRAGIATNVTPHMFRHSFATLLLEEDVDIRYIQRMLGHSSIQTTQIYTLVTTEKQRQILTARHPRNKIALKY